MVLVVGMWPQVTQGSGCCWCERCGSGGAWLQGAAWEAAAWQWEVIMHCRGSKGRSYRVGVLVLQ